MLLFKYLRVLRKMSFQTTGDTKSGLGLLSMSSLTMPAYSIMSNNTSLTTKEGIRVTHLDAGDGDHQVEYCKFRHHNYLERQQFFYHSNP
jgi:hypothetical protein